MMRQRINKSLLCIALFAFSSTFAINIRYIKDTYTILNPEFKHLSPAHGPIWWEKNLAENNYKYAGDPLAKYLFNVPQAEDFALAAAESSPANYFTPFTVGLLIGAIENMRPEIIQAQMRIAAIVQKKAPAAGQLSAKQIAAKKEVSALAAKLKKEVIITLQEDRSYQDRIQTYLATLPAIDQKVAQSTINSLLERKVIPAILSSLTLSGFFELIGDLNNLMYPPYQTYFIIHAFLYRKAQEIKEGKNVGKEDFKAYFDGLVQKLGPDIFTQAGAILLADSTWLFDAYDNSELLRHEIADAITQMKAFDRAAVDELYEPMVFAELTKTSELPKIAGYRNGTLFMGHTFTNCADNVVRNLCNIAMYDQETNSFTFNRIQGANPNPEAVKFYEEFSHADNIESQSIHNAWNLVVQNRPYVAYEQIFDINNPEAHAWVGLNQDFKGFILQTNTLKPRPFAKKREITFRDGTKKEFPELEVNGTIFVLVDPNQYAAYEVEPTVRNIVILMNEILGLRLYDDISKAFFDADFNTKYCTALFRKLGWAFTSNVDLTAQKIRMPVGTAHGSFELLLSWGHGEIWVISTSKIQDYQKKILSWQMYALENIRAGQAVDQKIVNGFMNDLLFINLFALYYFPYDYSEYFKVFNPAKSLKSLNYFIQPLRSSFSKLTLLEYIIKMQEIDFYPLCVALIERLDVGADLYYLKQLLKIDFSQVNVVNQSLLEAVNNKCDVLFERPITRDSIEIAKELLKQDMLIEKATLLAQKACEDIQPPEVVNLGLSLYQALWDKGMVREIAGRTALRSLETGRVPSEAINIFKKMIEAKSNISLVIEAARKLSEIPGAQRTSLALLNKLVEIGQAQELAQAVASHAMDIEDMQTQMDGLKIFEELVKNWTISDAAVSAAQKGAESSQVLVPHEAMQLWGELLKKGIGIETAQLVAQKLLKVDAALAIRMLTLLVQNGQDYQLALNIVKTIIKPISKDRVGVQETVIGLLIELVKKGQGFNCAQDVIRSVLNLDRTNPESAYLFQRLRKAAYALIGELVNQDVEFDQALSIASHLVKSDNFEDRNSGYYIFQKLARRGKYVHESLQVAQDTFDGKYGGSFSDEVRAFKILEELVLGGNATSYEQIHKILLKYGDVSASITLDIYHQLVMKNYQAAYQDALEMAYKFEKSKNEQSQKAAQQLLSVLKEKGIE